MAFPRPPINDVNQDDSAMHYVRDGDFQNSDIGARPVAMPKKISEGQRMGIKHVGGKE